MKLFTIVTAMIVAIAMALPQQGDNVVQRGSGKQVLDSMIETSPTEAAGTVDSTVNNVAVRDESELGRPATAIMSN